MSADAQRAAFEGFVLSKPGANAKTLYRVNFVGATRIGEYASSSVEFGWLSWQAAAEQTARICERLGADASNAACADAIRKGAS